MEEFADSPINQSQLTTEIGLLNLPNYIGVARLSRRQNPEGQWIPSEPYILIKCGTLTPTQKQRLAEVVANHVPQPIIPTFPTSTHWATISAMNPGAVKPLTTQRHYEGYTYTFDCHVSSEIVELWQAGKLLIGDYVLIEFVEHDINRPVAFVKVQKTW